MTVLELILYAAGVFVLRLEFLLLLSSALVSDATTAPSLAPTKPPSEESSDGNTTALVALGCGMVGSILAMIGAVYCLRRNRRRLIDSAMKRLSTSKFPSVAPMGEHAWPVVEDGLVDEEKGEGTRDTDQKPMSRASSSNSSGIRGVGDPGGSSKEGVVTPLSCSSSAVTTSAKNGVLAGNNGKGGKGVTEGRSVSARRFSVGADKKDPVNADLSTTMLGAVGSAFLNAHSRTKPHSTSTPSKRAGATAVHAKAGTTFPLPPIAGATAAASTPSRLSTPTLSIPAAWTPSKLKKLRTPLNRRNPSFQDKKRVFPASRKGDSAGRHRPRKAAVNFNVDCPPNSKRRHARRHTVGDVSPSVTNLGNRVAVVIPSGTRPSSGCHRPPRRKSVERTDAPFLAAVVVGEGTGTGYSVQNLAESVVGRAEALEQDANFIPGMREAAAAVVAVARGAAGSRGSAKGCKRRLRWCRSMVQTLERASRVLGKAVGHDGETEDVLLEDIQECVESIGEIMQSYRSKGATAKMCASTLCKRRRDETEVAISTAAQRLQPVIMKVRAGRTVQSMEQMVVDKSRVERNTSQEIVAGSKKRRRQETLNQLEISAADLEIFETEVLGRGGSGTVYLADLNGLTAAAKVVALHTGRDSSSDNPGDAHALRQRGAEEGLASSIDKISSMGDRRSPRITLTTTEADSALQRRRAFLRELIAMKRLRGPHTIHIFGAVTSSRDHVVLAMELLPGGDLRSRLRKAAGPLDEPTLRGIVTDVCSGMSFLHAKGHVHGSLTSSNVLFDGKGKAKITDFHASLWSRHTSHRNTSWATSRRSIGARLLWTAPEVLEGRRATCESDTYSFGIVVWECLTRKLPWVEFAGLDTICKSVTSGERPALPTNAPDDLASLTRACWAHHPALRPPLKRVLAALDGSYEGGSSDGDGGGGDTETPSTKRWSSRSAPSVGNATDDACTPRKVTSGSLHSLDSLRSDSPRGVEPLRISSTAPKSRKTSVDEDGSECSDYTSSGSTASSSFSFVTADEKRRGNSDKLEEFVDSPQARCLPPLLNKLVDNTHSTSIGFLSSGGSSFSSLDSN